MLSAYIFPISISYWHAIFKTRKTDLFLNVESFFTKEITMFVPRPSQTNTGYPSHISMADKPDVRPSVFIPMVYEQVAAEPNQWEYHVLTIDPRETALP